MQDSHSTMEGFQLMERNQVSGIAVNSANGELFANLSASDFLYSMASSPSVVPELLVLPVHVFLHKQSGRHLVSAPVTVSPNSPLEDVIRRMVTFQVHRVYVVDENRKPIGIITPFEILALFRTL